MTTKQAVTPRMDEAMVWIDRDQAIITTADGDGDPIVEQLGRGPSEPEVAFDARAVDQVGDRGTVVVSGPVFARTSFERVYTSMTHRPERLVDVEPGIDAADVADHPARRS